MEITNLELNDLRDGEIAIITGPREIGFADIRVQCLDGGRGYAVVLRQGMANLNQSVLAASPALAHGLLCNKIKTAITNQQAKTTETVQFEKRKDGSPVFICNAPNKTGGNCKRHVKQGQLCWQHKLEQKAKGAK